MSFGTRLATSAAKDGKLETRCFRCLCREDYAPFVEVLMCPLLALSCQLCPNSQDVAYLFATKLVRARRKGLYINVDEIYAHKEPT